MRTLRALIFSFTFGPAFALALNQDCALKSDGLLHSAKIYHEMDRPGNLAASKLGLIEGRADHKLLLLAFQLLEKKAPDSKITKEMILLCKSFKKSDLQMESSFFIEGGNTPPHLTVCGDIADSIFQQWESSEQELAESIGNSPGPETKTLVKAAVDLKKGGHSPRRSVEKLFELCQKRSDIQKKKLGKEFYAE